MRIALSWLFMIVGFVAFMFLIAGCATTKFAVVKAQGLYFVHPSYGLIGLGTIEYQRLAEPDPK